MTLEGGESALKSPPMELPGPPEIGDENDNDKPQTKINSSGELLRPLAHLPQPEAPRGLLTRSKSDGTEEAEVAVSFSRSISASAGPAVDVSSIGKYIRERGNSFSAAIARRISSLKDSSSAGDGDFTEIHLSGMKVVVHLKKDHRSNQSDVDFKGRISFFSRSGCRDCGAVRSFFKDRGLKFTEINVDVYPSREKELIERTGSASVPQIFFNEKLLGGLVALNSLRNSGEFDRRLWEMAGKRCPETAPRAPLYGFEDDDDSGKERTDVMIGIVRVLRQRLPIQDRLMKMKIVKNCFAGREMVEAIIQHLDCGRKKAVEIGKELARKHFIHHVFRENDFEDGNHYYRFLEHDPAIPRCYNFREYTNDDEPKPASLVGQRLTKIMSAILEAYASNDLRHVDYNRISSSEEFRRYVNLVQDLHRVDVFALSTDEKTAFFLNLYNAMVVHAVIRVGQPGGVIDRKAFFNDFQYVIGGYAYNLNTIKNGILRNNRRQPYSLIKPFHAGDKRLEVALQNVNPLIHFGICNSARSSPTIRFFSAKGIEAELRYAAREFFHDGGVEVDLEKRTVHLTRIIKWYSIDFGQEKEVLKWILSYLDATKAGLLTHLLNDGGPINIFYQHYDWSLNT
ncbi:hypothetical protein QJS04_geneDACA019573 [Acorus gramineus]|uniref:DEP domain-containing protein n=1 Tax=Acorus gramineus TaxID=55184 RepID=A0AAV9ADY1_ACOGR|nr:hypothetical protein QJS04_geneDACA019573 [Acorus gramineus]